MNRLYEIFKTPSSPSKGRALLNHTIFSPSQTGETVPLNNRVLTAVFVPLLCEHISSFFQILAIRWYYATPVNNCAL
jgi:hypothetical protein